MCKKCYQIQIIENTLSQIKVKRLGKKFFTGGQVSIGVALLLRLADLLIASTVTTFVRMNSLNHQAFIRQE